METPVNAPTSAQGAAPAASTTAPTPARPTAVRTIEDLRRRACTPIARSLAVAFGSGHARERFDASMELAEGIAERACQLLNSLYLRSARDLGTLPLPHVEQRMLELGRKNLSFGDYVSAMELFLTRLDPADLHGSIKALWDELAAPLKEPVLVGEDIACLELLKQAREKYGVPVSSLDRYLDDHKGSPQKKSSIVSVLRWAATYRNAKAHHHAWFADDERWYGLLLQYWRRLLERTAAPAGISPPRRHRGGHHADRRADDRPRPVSMGRDARRFSTSCVDRWATAGSHRRRISPLVDTGRAARTMTRRRSNGCSRRGRSPRTSNRRSSANSATVPVP